MGVVTSEEVTGPMTKTKETPAAALAKAQADAAAERKLNVYLDRILDQEELRSDASLAIAATWKEMRKAGVDVVDARRQLVRRALTRPTI